MTGQYLIAVFALGCSDIIPYPSECIMCTAQCSCLKACTSPFRRTCRWIVCTCAVLRAMLHVECCGRMLHVQTGLCACDLLAVLMFTGSFLTQLMAILSYTDGFNLVCDLTV